MLSNPKVTVQPPVVASQEVMSSWINEPIDFPEVVQPNVMVCLTQDAYNSNLDIIRPGGILLTDPSTFRQ